MKDDIGTYECEGVEQEDYDAFKDSESKGKHFNKAIKGNFMSKDFTDYISNKHNSIE